MIRNSFIILSLILATACSEPQQTAEPVEPVKEMPPSFLDEAPPPPTSNTEILGGGTLVTPDGAFIEDSLIVITDGKLVAWGKRGDVDVPNDSIGHDLRGKWIQAQNLEVGALADLRFSERTRGMTEVSSEILGGYQDGTIDLPAR